MRKTCIHCVRSLPLQQFNLAGKQGRSGVCVPCTNDMRRLRAPLPAQATDVAQVRINNAAALWFGPVRPMPRYAV